MRNAMNTHDTYHPDDYQWRIVRIDELAKLPTKVDNGSSGYDLSAIEYTQILPGESALIRTGLQWAVPFGWEVQIRSRSGLAAKNDVFVLNSPGTIDASYRGEVKVILKNSGQKMFEVKPGDRIAQAVLQRVPDLTVVEVQVLLGTTTRGTGGFGSSGV
jgi:dUTP pyrophosphatase